MTDDDLPPDPFGDFEARIRALEIHAVERIADALDRISLRLGLLLNLAAVVIDDTTRVDVVGHFQSEPVYLAMLRALDVEDAHTLNRLRQRQREREER